MSLRWNKTRVLVEQGRGGRARVYSSEMATRVAIMNDVYINACRVGRAYRQLPEGQLGFNVFCGGGGGGKP